MALTCRDLSVAGVLEVEGFVLRPYGQGTASNLAESFTNDLWMFAVSPRNEVLIVLDGHELVVADFY